MMTSSGIVFEALATLLLGSALVGVVVARRGNALVGAFLLCMISLSGMFALLDAHLLAVAQLSMSLTLGLLLYFSNGILLGFHSGADDLPKPGPWRWLVAMVGVGVTSGLGMVLYRLSAAVPGKTDSSNLPDALSRSGALGAAMFGDYAIAVVGVGFLLLSALIGAGLLARRGLD